MTQHCVYKLTDTSGLKYYGVTKNYSKRIRDHLSGNGSQEIKIAIDMGEKFTSNIVFLGTEEECYKKEAELVSLDNTIFPFGYNISKGGYQGGTSCRQGSNNTQAILQEKQVLEIRNIYADGKKTQLQLAKEYNVTRETISAIVRGKSWSEVAGPITIKHYKDKKTPETLINQIINLRKNTKLTYREIADQLNISLSVAAKYGKGAR